MKENFEGNSSKKGFWTGVLVGCISTIVISKVIENKKIQETKKDDVTIKSLFETLVTKVQENIETDNIQNELEHMDTNKMEIVEAESDNEKE